MKERFLSRIKTFWILYAILFLLSFLGSVIPYDNDLIWLWGFAFYLPFAFFLVYPYSFVMGMWVQHKTKGTTIEIFCSALAYFILFFFLFYASNLKGVFLNGILYHIDVPLIFASGSTVAFALGTLLCKWIQRKRNSAAAKVEKG